MRLTESELKQVVEASVRKILMKEDVFKKAGDAIDRFENWADDKMDNLHRGYDLKEGNPTSIFDVINGDGWEPIKSRNGLKNGMNYVGVKKVRGSWFQANGLTDEKLVEDINIFLDGRGHASLYETVNDNYSILAIDAPLNLFEKAEVNESVYGDDGFESTMSNDSDLPVKENKYMEETVGRAILYLGDEVEDGVFVSARKFGLRNKSLNGQKITNLFVDDEGLITGRGKYGQLVSIGTTKDSFSFSELTKETQEALYNMAKGIITKRGGYVNESFEMGGDMVKFYLNSPMNGRQVIIVPFEEFANAQYKNDYLWEKAAEQGNIKLMRNGYFEVDPNDPHKAEVDRIF